MLAGRVAGRLADRNRIALMLANVTASDAHGMADGRRLARRWFGSTQPADAVVFVRVAQQVEVVKLDGVGGGAVGFQEQMPVAPGPVVAGMFNVVRVYRRVLTRPLLLDRNFCNNFILGVRRCFLVVSGALPGP